MRIKALETRNFGRLPDGRIEFGSGLTVVNGPNEAGKSFTIKAIYAGLFDEAASRTEERESWRKWGGNGPFEVTLELELGDGLIRLRRDLDRRKAVLTKADGTEVTDKKTVGKLVGEMLGLPSLKSFQATACVLQDSVRAIDVKDAGLKQLLEGQLAGAGAATDALLTKLNSERNKIRPVRAKGLLGELEEQRKLHQSSLQALREKLDLLVANKRELEAINAQLVDKGEEFEDLDKAYKGARQYREADSACDGASTLFGEAEGNLKKWKAAQEGADAARRRVAEIAPRLQGLAAQVDLEAALADQAGWNTRVAAWEQSSAEIEKLEKEILDIAQVDEAELRRANNLASEIDAQERTLFEQLFQVKVEPEKGVAFTIQIDGEMLEGSEGTAHHLATVEFPGTGVIRMENVTAGVPELAAKLEELQAEHAGILRKYGVADISTLDGMFRAYSETAGYLETERRRRAEALAGLGPEQLQAEAGQSAERARAARAAVEALGPVFVSEDDLKMARENRDSLVREEAELKETIAGHEAILGHLGAEDALASKRDEALGALAIARSKREAVAMYECDLTQYAKIERQHEAMAVRLAELRDLRGQLNYRVEDKAIGEEDVAAAEERLAEVQGKIDRLEHRRRVLDIIHTQITAARRATIGQFSEGLQLRMGEILARITDGRYNRVAIDGDLGVSIYSPEKDAYLDMKDDRSLSGGTRDQVFLAARIALLELIAGETHPPLIMDDTFCSFDDMGRKERAFEMLAALAERNQILYFTCQDCPETLPTLNLA